MNELCQESPITGGCPAVPESDWSAPVKCFSFLLHSVNITWLYYPDIKRPSGSTAVSLIRPFWFLCWDDTNSINLAKVLVLHTFL